ncbi:MAG: hypothetical protein PHG85_00670 [Candidatus Altiarchaeota archaeon]|nr:hypothetical protein [Candidatus Altiarchaeota archaeon]
MKEKKPFFIRAGRTLRKSPPLAAITGIILLTASILLLQEKGTLFIIGFCAGLLGLTSLYITMLGLRR